MKSLSVWIVAASIGLTACSTTHSGAPVYELRNSPIPVPWPKPRPKNIARAPVRPEKSTSAPRATGGGTHVVTRGETLYAIARQRSIPLRDLIHANNLRPPYSLAVGQRLRLPAAQVHVVARGETSYGISRRYGVTVSDLVRQNRLKKPYSLSVGQRLTIPSSGSAGAGKASKPKGRSKGRTTALAVPPPRSASGFLWPVSGVVSSRFGPKKGGLHNDGINIVADAGSPVRASEAGVVAYASDALEGYGNLLLIKHADGWVTAYAHNDALLVSEGTKVKRGEIVARVGRTGGVSRPQLHFEIRKGRRAYDPLKYIQDLAPTAR